MEHGLEPSQVGVICFYKAQVRSDRARVGFVLCMHIWSNAQNTCIQDRARACVLCALDCVWFDAQNTHTSQSKNEDTALIVCTGELHTKDAGGRHWLDGGARRRG